MATQNSTAVLDDPRIVMMDVGKLTPRKNNPRTHSPKQIRQIADCSPSATMRQIGQIA